MNRKLLFLILLSIVLVGCGNKTTTVDLSAEKVQETKNKTEIVDELIVEEKSATEIEKQEIDEKTEEEKEVLFDKDVDIVFGYYSFEEEPINEYVDRINKEEPGNKYSVYDDKHYVYTIKESERKEFLKKIDSEVEETFYDVFNSEETKDVFISVDYDELLENITFYAEKEKYKENEFMSEFSVIFISTIFSDSVQAYNLVSPEDRVCNILILDNETKEVLYNSNEK